MNTCNAEGQTLLHEMCLEGDTNKHFKTRKSHQYFPPTSTKSDRSRIRDMLDFLLEHGADITCRDNKGETPLHAIVQRKGVTGWETDLLVRRGVDTKTRDNQDHTALQVADINRNVGVTLCIISWQNITVYRLSSKTLPWMTILVDLSRPSTDITRRLSTSERLGAKLVSYKEETKNKVSSQSKPLDLSKYSEIPNLLIRFCWLAGKPFDDVKQL